MLDGLQRNGKIIFETEQANKNPQVDDDDDDDILC
jgi:hypothetical protein